MHCADVAQTVWSGRQTASELEMKHPSYDKDFSRPYNPTIIADRYMHLHSMSARNRVKQLNVGTPRNPALSPAIFSKRVKHNRTVECGQSQGINFVARHPLKACKTQ